MLLDSVVQASAAVAANSGRLAKIEEIARLLREVPAPEIPVAVAFLSGDLTQRQIGVGYAALTDLLGEDGAVRRQISRTRCSRWPRLIRRSARSAPRPALARKLSAVGCWQP